MCAPPMVIRQHGSLAPVTAGMQARQNRNETGIGGHASTHYRSGFCSGSWVGNKLQSYQPGLRNAPPRRPPTCSAVANPPFTIHLGETSLTIPFTTAAATRLDESIKRILQLFKEKEGQAQRRRLESMEFVDKDKVDVEIICNPNAYANAFQAKVLISVKVGDSVKFSSEGQLSTLRADVATYLES
eukprot:jgi/Mesvir1/5113/Mv15272-RA.1